MFSKWLETQSDNASWDQLIQAVKNIRLNHVANNIEQLLLQGEYVTVLLIGASLSEPHTNDKFVRWFVRGKTAVKSSLPHTTVKFGRVVQAL